MNLELAWERLGLRLRVSRQETFDNLRPGRSIARSARPRIYPEGRHCRGEDEEQS
jgi:hypothetical protein